MVMERPKAGIALIVFQGREQNDLDGVLKDCAEAGYSCVETGFIFNRYTPEQIKEVCQRHNLEYAAGHGGYDTISDERKLEKTIKDIKGTGGSYIICSGMSQQREGVEAYKESAGVFNKAGRIAKDAGLIFCYHNHAFEFGRIGRTKGIHILAEETDPDFVKFNIDVSWVQIGRESPADFIRRYRTRAGYYHFKDAIIKGFANLNTEADLSKPFRMENVTWTELGKGNIQLKEAYQAAIEAGADYIVYEEDISQIEVTQAITDSRKFLKGLGI